MLKSAVGREEVLAALERPVGLWLWKEDSAAQEFALQKCLTEGWAKDTVFLFSLAEEEGQMMQCLEFQEYFSHDFCPLVLGTLLVLEVIGMGLAFLSPCSAVSYVLCRPQAAFAGCRRVVTGAVFLFHTSPVWLDPEAAPAELGWEQHIEHRGADAAQLHAQESVPLCWGTVSYCVWLPGITAGSGAWCCQSAACSLSVASANCDGEAIVQLSRAGVRCCHNVAGNGVSPPVVSGGIFCALQSQVWLLLSSPNALSWYMLFCVFPAVPLQALGPKPSSRTLSPTRDMLAMEPA